MRSLLLFSLILFAGCKVDIPKEVIMPDKMENILYDYHLAQAITADHASESYEKKLHINYVFAKYGVTQEQFDSSLVWYTRYPRHLVKIYSRLEERLQQEVDAIEGGTTTLSGVAGNENMLADTLDLWRGARVRLLSSAALCNRVVFTYTADSTYITGDSISLSFTAKYLSQNKDALMRRAHAALVVEYADESTAARGIPLAGNAAYSVAVERNYDSDIKSFYGFIYYADNDSLCLSKLLIGDISVKRIHPEKEE